MPQSPRDTRSAREDQQIRIEEVHQTIQTAPTAQLAQIPAQIVATYTRAVPGLQYWLDGDAIFCGCPECSAPMTVRLWLLVAECWSCGTHIELTEEQERQIHRLILETARKPNARKPDVPLDSPNDPTRPDLNQPDLNRPDPTRPDPVRGSMLPLPPEFNGELLSVSATASATRSPATSTTRLGIGAGIARTQRKLTAQRFPQTRVYRVIDLFRELPAWLVSLILHLVAVILLMLLTLDITDVRNFITLSTAVHTNPMLGGEVAMSNPFEQAFDLPLPEGLDLNDIAKREAVVRADQDARELRLEGVTHNPHLPQVEKMKQHVTSTIDRQAFAARDPRIRVELIRAEGGTTLTEAAVARGLRWLAQHQGSDGSWSLHAFHRAAGCRCRNAGIHSDSAGTALALLPFLGAGQTHLVGRYQAAVAQGLRWLLEHQLPNGDLRAGSHDNAGMYAHGQGTIVLSEAYAMTGDVQLQNAAQRAVGFIVDAQHERGGWRYQPLQPGDTSVLGWQLLALQSARFAGVDFPDSSLELAGHYLDSCQHELGSQYGYLPGAESTPVMTAEAILCRMYLGWRLDNPAIRRAGDYLLQHLPSRNSPNIYYWYYATQAMHHIGGERWSQWNRHIREILVETQETTGHQSGSWTPMGPHADAGGRVYQTALSICTLEVYYRHLPIFRQLELD